MFALAHIDVLILVSL